MSKKNAKKNSNLKRYFLTFPYCRTALEFQDSNISCFDYFLFR